MSNPLSGMAVGCFLPPCWDHAFLCREMGEQGMHPSKACLA